MGRSFRRLPGNDAQGAAAVAGEVKKERGDPGAGPVDAHRSQTLTAGRRSRWGGAAGAVGAGLAGVIGVAGLAGLLDTSGSSLPVVVTSRLLPPS